jgi:GNAT superfamily N-acetyltransferase
MWRSRLSGPGSVTVAAEVPGGSRDRAVGLAGGFTPPGAADPELVSVWVEPAWRGTGLAAGLITAVADWAVAAGAASLRLWVTTANRAARRRYETLGFVATGEVALLQSDPTRTEEAMVLMLA